MPHGMNLVSHPWVLSLTSHLSSELTRLSDHQSEQLARLVPALLCGEQSAVCVFQHEAQRLSAQALHESAKLISGIEKDELGHEQTLRALVKDLPYLDELSAIKRHARRFFSIVSRSSDLAQHFSRIAQLDGTVCIIVHAISKGQLGRLACLKEMLDRIKRDEARHAFLSRRHALALGANRSILHEEGAWIGPRLINMLMPVADALEALQVDPDRLFSKILRHS
jgi:hypothetical protein